MARASTSTKITYRLHEKLRIGTKELQPLQIGAHVMIQNQLGNKPKQWDKRGFVIQVQPETSRQYKVMTFGSRRITLRNRRFMRKYTPVQIPDNTPTGFSKPLSVSEHAPVPPQLI